MTIENNLDDPRARVKYCRLGYVSTLIKHFWHGSKTNRKYNTRYKMLVKYQFNPNTMLSLDEQGLLIHNKNFPKPLLKYIQNYFLDRKEDE